MFFNQFFSQHLHLYWRIKSHERSHASQEWSPLLLHYLPLNMKHLLGKKLKNRTLTLSILRRSTCYEIPINTFLRRDQVHFNLKFSHKNKTALSSPSYFCICIFERIHALHYPCTIIPSMLKGFRRAVWLQIFPLLSLHNWEKN